MKIFIDNKYFIDKSLIISTLFDYIDSSDNYICLTRPRRFGKSTIAHMISAFFTKGADNDELFKDLIIYKSPLYADYKSKFNTVTIDFSDNIAASIDFFSYLLSIKTKLISDFKEIYPKLELNISFSLNDIFNAVHNFTKDTFIFILDEWDALFNADFMQNNQMQKKYLQLLKELLKDKPYVNLVYMTGIMLIKKFSDGSDLNMFTELNMATDSLFCNY
jgi:Cdc6-like AAA superfamily ATPase